MRTPDERFGAPFDMVLRCSTQLEDDRSLGDALDLVPVVAHIVSLLGDGAVGQTAAAVINNELRVLAELTPQGEPTMLAAPAYLRWVFRGRQVARHFADHVLSQLVSSWTVPDGSAEGVTRERGIASTNGVGSVDDLMMALQVDDDGQRLLGEFDNELARSWRAKRPKPREMPLSLRDAEESFAERLHEAAGKAAVHVSTIAGAYTDAVDREVRRALEQTRLGLGANIAGSALKRVTGMEDTLLRQREGLKSEQALAGAEATAAFEHLEEAAGQIRTGWLKGLQQPFKVYVNAATNEFRLRFASALTEAALGALANSRGALSDLAESIEAEQAILDLVAARCRKAVADFESRAVTPIEDITERPLFDAADLHALYLEVGGAPWDAVADVTAARVRHGVGGLARWLGQDFGTVYGELVAATMPAFERVASVTADDFVRWQYGRRGVDPDLFLRDCERGTPLLCRFDRARLPGGRDQRAASFVIVGVPDRDRSVFFSTPHALLVTTDDPDHIVFLRLRLGYPASALWQYDRYRAGRDEVAKSGRVAQDIYPGFPHELWRKWHEPQVSGPKTRRRRRAARKSRRGS